MKHRHSNRRRFVGPAMVLWLLCGTVGGLKANADEMLQLLQQMVKEDPTRSDSWRMIGRIHRQNDRLTEARVAFEQALDVQPDNVAAHSDLAQLLADAGEDSEAAEHFDLVMTLAPSSSYAQELVERGIRPAPTPQTTADARPTRPFDRAVWSDNAEPPENVTPVGFEIQTFDGADDLSRRLQELEAEAAPEPNRLRAYVEFGSLYNTNVSLTPISRELTGSEAASAQLFLSPDLEWTFHRRGSWRTGALARGNFTLNENHFKSLNLFSFQPGVFVERDFERGDNQWIGRLDYVYSVDVLDTEQFADRHSVTASLTSILPDNDVIYGYFTTGYANFANDGLNPAVDSLDGLSFTTGVSRFFQTDLRLLPRWSLGTDLEHANTRGADYRYNAITLHGDATVPLSESVSFIPAAGIGYRDYGDFTGAVNRDELTWRLGAKLKWQIREKFSVSAIVGYDRFASDNDQFDTERMQAGVGFTFMH